MAYGKMKPGNNKMNNLKMSPKKDKNMTKKEKFMAILEAARKSAKTKTTMRIINHVLLPVLGF